MRFVALFALVLVAAGGQSGAVLRGGRAGIRRRGYLDAVLREMGRAEPARTPTTSGPSTP